MNRLEMIDRLSDANLRPSRERRDDSDTFVQQSGDIDRLSGCLRRIRQPPGSLRAGVFE